MSDVKVTTDHKPRNIIDAYELTEAERAEFDYLDWAAINAGRDSASFVRYHGRLFDLGEAMQLTNSAPWEGYWADTAFSSYFVRYVGDDQVIMAYATS